MHILRAAFYISSALSIGVLAQPNKTSSSDITHSVLARIPIPELPGWESRLVLAKYPVGSNAALHNHPVPGLGYVLEGSLLSEWEDGNVEIYNAGDSFMDLAETIHVQAGPADPTKGVSFIISYVIPVGEANIKDFQ